MGLRVEEVLGVVYGKFLKFLLIRLVRGCVEVELGLDYCI